MVEAAIVEIGNTIPYLNKKIVNENGVKVIKIETEPDYVVTEFDGKQSRRLECIASTEVLDPKKVKWTMNPTSSNWMVKQYGSDTKKWIGLTLPMAVKQAGGANPGVYPKNCSLEKVIE